MILLLIAATASAIFRSSKLLKHKMQRKRQALARNFAVKGVISGPANTGQPGVTTYSGIESPSTRSGVETLTFPGAKSTDVPWEFKQCLGNPDFWVNGLGVWQDDFPGDEKGVVKIQFQCARRENYKIYTRRHELGKDNLGAEVPLQECPDEDLGHGVKSHRWIVGMKIVTGGESIGIVQIIPICQGAHEQTGCPRNRPILMDYITVSTFDWKIHQNDNNGWQLSREVKCDEGKAVCGISTKYNEDQKEKDPGLTSIAIDCCPFPPAGTLDAKKCPVAET